MPEAWPGDVVEPMTKMRQLISDHMVVSRRTSAHVTSVFEVDLTRVARIRSKKQAEFSATSGQRLSYLPFIIRAVVDGLLSDDFTFTSAAPDDHISKTAFKKNCWDTQIEHIKNFDLELVMAKGDFVTVRWLCHTTNGKAFRDVEVHRLRSHKIEALECYFGGPAGFPTAVESQKS